MKEYNITNNEKYKLRLDTLDLIKRIYKKHYAGGALHIVLDDGNICDEDIKWCVKNLDEDSYIEDFRFSESDIELFKQVANNMLKMSCTQRKKLVTSNYH